MSLKEKILIIEDSPTQRAVLANLLTELGLEPITTDSFDHVISELIEEHSIKTVLLDLILVDDDGSPIGDGFQICNNIKANNPDTRIIVISAETDSAAKELAISQGADGFICKPFTLKEIEIKLKN